HAVAAGDGLADQLAQGAQLAAVLVAEVAALELHQARVAGYLAQAGERGEDLDLRLGDALLVDLGQDALADLGEDLLVEHGLIVLEGHDHLLLDLLGQVSGDVRLEAAQDEGADGRAQARHRLLVATLDGPRHLLFVGLEAAEQPRRDEVEDAPDLAEAILDGRARQGEEPLARELLGRAGRVAHRVLDVRRLVEDDVAQAEAREQPLVPAQERVARDHHVGRLEGLAALFTVRALPDDGLEARRELLDLAGPVGHDRGRGDDEGELALLLALGPGQERDGLQGLTEAHVVGEDAAAAELVDAGEPAEALLLVGPQGGLDGARLGDVGDLADLVELVEEGLGGGRDGGVADDLEQVVDAARLAERQLLALARGGVDLRHAGEDVADGVRVDRREAAV